MAAGLVRSCGDGRDERRRAASIDGPGVEAAGARASARCSTRVTSSTPTRPTPTTSGRCSSSTRARSATTSTGTSARRGAVDGLAPAAARRPRRPAGDEPTATGSGSSTSRPTSSARPWSAARSTARSLRDPVAPRPASAPSHDALGCADDALEAETRLHDVAERIRGPRWGRPRPIVAPTPGGTATSPRPSAPTSTSACSSRVTIAAAADDLGVGPTQLARGFTDAFAIAAARLRRSAAAWRSRATGSSTASRWPTSPPRSASSTRPTSPAGSSGSSGTTPGQFGHGARSRTDRVPVG